MSRTAPLALVLALLAASPARGQAPSGEDGSRGPALWATVGAAGGAAAVIAGGKSAVGPVGWATTVEAALSIGHRVSVGALFLATGLGGNESVYQSVVSYEAAAFADIGLVNTLRWRWFLRAGAGFALEKVRIERYPFDAQGNLIPSRDVDGDGRLDVVPVGYTVRTDTGPAALGGTGVAFFPLEYLSLTASVLVDYRYSPNLTLQEGALLVLGLVGLRADF